MDFLYTRFIILYIFYKLHFTFFKVIYEYRKPAYFRRDVKTAELCLNIIKENNLISGQQASVLLFGVLNYFCFIKIRKEFISLVSYLKNSSVAIEIFKRYRHIKTAL